MLILTSLRSSDVEATLRPFILKGTVGTVENTIGHFLTVCCPMLAYAQGQ